MKKILLLLLVLSSLHNLWAWTGSGATAGDPYQITTAADLAELTINVNGGNLYAGKYFKLTADINLATYLASASWGASGWLPIGNATKQFKGKFDGNSHKISGLTLKRATTDFVGLFGILGDGGSISNLGVEISTDGVTGKEYVGGLAGANYGEISNCYASGAVTGNYSVGGLVGLNDGTEYDAGNYFYAKINNSYASVKVNGGDQVGGLVGKNQGEINNCYASGAVTGTVNYVGGLVGVNTVVIGFMGDYYHSKISNSYASGAVSAVGAKIGGLAGINDDATITNSFWDKTVNSAAALNNGCGTATTTIDMQKQTTYTAAGWVFPSTWKISEGTAYPTLAWQVLPQNSGMTLVFDTNLEPANNTVTLPLSGTVNVVVDWGDGTAAESVTTNTNKTHTYANDGIYTVKITGTLTQFGYGADYNNAVKLIKVTSFGDIGLTSLSGAFRKTTNLTEVPAVLPATVTSLSGSFFGTGKASITNLDLWDVSKVTNMSQMFANASTFNQNIGNWNTSSVNSITQMFQNATAFNQNIGSWNVSKITDMTYVFYGASAFNQNIGGWNMSNVTNMYGILRNASAFNQDISGWDVSKVTIMCNTFSGASAFNQDIGNWNVSNVTDMNLMFQGASTFNKNIGGWNVSKVLNMSAMFHSASAFNQDIGSWNVGSVTNMSSMFYAATLFNQNIGAWGNKTSNVTFLRNMFGNASAFNQNISSWNVSKVTDLGYMFNGASAFNQDISNWDVSKVTDMSSMFNNARAFNQNIGGWNMGAVTNFNNMFLYVTLSPTNYDALLNGWATTGKTFATWIPFHGGNSKYTAAGKVGRDALTAKSWRITDGGLYNNAPTDMALSASAINENVAANSTVGTISSTDSDAGSTFTYTLVAGTGSTDNASFNISGNSLIITAAPDYETKSSYSIRLRTTDQGGLFFEKAFTITINDLNDAPMVLVFDTNLETANNTVTLPLYGTVNVVVDWGDGTATESVTTNANKTHTYANDGTYTVKITGTLTQFGSGADYNNAAKLTKVTSFGDIGLTTLNGAFRKTTNLTEVPAVLPATVTSLYASFFGTGKANITNLDLWDVSKVTNMSYMFANASAFNHNVGNWNTSSVNSMTQMFLNAAAFNQNIGGWDVSKVTDMNSVFSGARAFNQDVSSWNVSKVTNMAQMFANAKVFNQDIGIWNVDAVTDMRNMFDGATLFNQNISGWNVSNVTNMTAMFQNATAFNQNIGGWNVANVINMSSMFSGATVFNGNIGAWAGKTSKVTSMYGMLARTSAFNQDISSWNVGAVTNMSYMFYNATKFDQPIGNWNVGAVTNLSSTFQGASAFNQDISSWNVSKVTNMSSMFSGAMAFNQNIGGWDVGAVTDMMFMFQNTAVFNQDISSWNVSKVTNMALMFSSASAFNQNIGNWDVSKVTSMRSMFNLAVLFNQDISGWGNKTSAVTNMSSMFQSARVFNQNIGNWDVSNVTDMSNMFSSAIAFNQNIGGWNVGAVTNLSNMFNGATLSPTNYDALLNGWATTGKTFASLTPFHGGNSRYTAAGKVGRDALTAKMWNITDGGLDNNPPTDIALSASSINENVAANSEVGTLSSTDQDAANTFTYSLVAGTGSTDNAAFNISGNSLTIKASPDYETKNNYAIRLRTTDQGGLFYEKALTITITDVNEAPTISDIADLLTNEDTPTSAISFTIADVDAGANLTLSATSSNTSLIPVSNIVFGGSKDNRTVTITPMANQNGTSTITITVNDGNKKSSFSLSDKRTSKSITTESTKDPAGLTASDAFVLTVNPVNDAPACTTIPAISGSLMIGATITGTSGTWNDDLDGNDATTVTPTYQWQRADDDLFSTNLLSISNATNISYNLTTADKGKYLRLKVTGTDGGTPVLSTDAYSNSMQITIPTYSLTYAPSNAAYGSISGDKSQSVDAGTNGTTVTAVPATGYKFVNWSDDITTASRTDLNVAKNIDVTANFTIDQSQLFALTLNSNDNAMGSVTGAGNYYLTQQVTITATAKTGYKFVNWTDGATVVSTSASFNYSMPAESKTLTANFVLDQSQLFALTLNSNDDAMGSVTGAGNYYLTQQTTITATAKTGYKFVNWKDGATVVSTSASFNYSMPAESKTLTANFIVDPSQTFALNLTLGAHGTSVTGAGNYNVEHVQTITAVAATGYRFKNWTGDVTHVANVNSATTTVTQPASTVNLTANFEIDYGQTFALTAIAGANGTLAANYNGNYNTGSQVTLTAVPAVGYKFLNWTGNVSTLSSTTTATATLTMPAQNVNLTANFVVENEQLFALGLTLGAGGAAVVGAGNYPVTHQQQISATAATGYKFKNWTGDVAVITTGTANDAAVTVTMPAQATALTANFEVDPTQLYALSVLSNNTQFGTASDLTNTAPYNVNTIVNIKAVPKTGYRFTGWVSSNGGTFGNATTAETTFEMPAKAVILTASFEVDPAQLFALSVEAEANGTLGGNYDGSYTVGTQMNLTAIPNTGYKFLNWTGDVAFIGNNSKSTTVTLTMPAQAVNLAANFVPETSTLFALNLTLGAGGESVTGAGSYPVDHEQQLVAHAAAGYKFKTWTGDIQHIDAGLPTDAIVTVKMPAAIVNLTATFEIDPVQAYTLSLVSSNLQMGTVIDETATGPYTIGSVVNIKAVAAVGHRFTGWVSSNGGTIGNDFSAATTFTMPANNVLLTAGFEVDDGQTFALNVSAAPHGSLAANYNGYYHVETVKNISAAGDTGYRFKDWTGDVANISAGTVTDSAVTVTMPATAVALVAGFEVDPNQFFALNLTLGAHGTSVSGAGNYNVEHVQTITAVAATGYKFANWTGDVTNVADVNSATTTITMPASAVNLTANFIVDEAQTFALNLTLGAHGASVTGAGSYNVEHIQTITAVAATGYKFANWTGDVTNVADVNSATTTITIPASAVNLTANFIVDPSQTFALNLTLGAHGTSVTGAGNYYAEHIQTITAVAATGYKFANWTGDVTNVADVNSATTTITMPASAVNLTANFIVDQTLTFALNLTLGAHGTSVTGAGNYYAEHVQNITAAAATGYKFANWTGDVTNVANVNSASTTITMPASAVNLTANFVVDATQTFVLSLAANPAAYGNASLASGQAAGPYNAGTVVNVKAVANTGFKFINWTKPDKEIFAAANKNSAQKNREVVSTLPEFGYTMTAANTALTSNFKVDSAQTFALNITMSTGGQSVTGAGSYVVLHQQSITAVAAAGYQFKNWTGDISAVANANSATTTVTMPSATVNLTANFEMIVPILAVSADNLNYGNVYIGAEPVQTVKIYNAGASTLVGSIAEVSSPFSFVQTKNNRIKARMQKNRLSFELGMTDTLRLNVKFKPQDINSFLDTMLVTSNGSGISNKSVTLQGSATADPNSEPVLTLWPDSLIYGSMLVNTSREKKFNLKNNGGKVLTGFIRFPVEHQSVYLSTAKNNSKAGRAILDSVAFSLTSGSVATYASLFTPDSARNYLENISVVSNDLTATGRRNIKVTATGLANGVTLSKNLIDFGKVRVGVPKDTTIMIENNTAEDFKIIGIKGMNYGTTAAFTSADSSGITIPANSSRALNFRFKPQFPTAYRDTAKIYYDYDADTTKYLPVYLAGTGEYTGIANGSALVIKPMVVDYGQIFADNLYKGYFTVKNQDIDSTVVGFSLNFDNKYIRVIEQGAPVAKANKKGGKDYYFYYLHNGDSINFEVQLTMNSFAAAQIIGEQFLSKVWLYSNATFNPNQFVTLKGRTGAVEPGLRAFSLLSPADNYKPYANNIDLSWQSAKNASISGDVEYTAYIITPTDSIALPTTATTVNSGKQLKFNQKYEWTVKAKYGYQEKWANEKWSFELQQKGDATPNPFTPDSRDPNFATTKFDLFDKEDDLSVKIYSIGGKFISHVTLIKQIDRWTASWDGKNRNGDIVGPGVYLYQVYTGNKVLRNGFIGVIR